MDLEALKAHLRRPVSRMILGGFRPPAAPEASWFGRVRLAGAGEAWPTHDGEPMLPLCQINVRELPYLPPLLEDLALITLFISATELPFDTPNGDGWELRAYSTLEGLVELEAPEIENGVRPVPVRWERVEDDYPSWDDVVDELPEEICENYHTLFEQVEGSKVGGWPHLIQGQIEWASEEDRVYQYAFQIDSEEKADWMWGDVGTGYVGRGVGDNRNQWLLSWQCY